MYVGSNQRIRVDLVIEILDEYLNSSLDFNWTRFSVLTEKSSRLFT